MEILRLLYSRLLPLATSLARRDPDDLVQETLLRVLIQHPDFAGISYPMGYAKAVLVRLATRRGFRRESWALEEMADWLEEPDADAWEDRVVARVDISASLRKLPPRQRACLILKHLEGLSDDQIAALLGVRPSTVRAQSARAISHLRGDAKDVLTRQRTEDEEEGE